MPNNGNPGGDTGNTANFYDGDHTVGSPYWTTPVGQFGLSESPYNTFDQGGNLWEWNETAFYAGSSPAARGGSWSDYSDNLAASTRSYSNPTREIYSIGFRVASIEAAPGAVPEPSTLIIWSILATCGFGFGWRSRHALRRSGT